MHRNGEKMKIAELCNRIDMPEVVREKLIRYENEIDVAEIEAENIKLTQSIKEKDSEIAKLQSDLKTVIDNVMASTNITIVKALNGKADSIDSQIKSIEAEKTAIDEEIASNNRRIADEIKSQSRKELDSLSLEGKG